MKKDELCPKCGSGIFKRSCEVNGVTIYKIYSCGHKITLSNTEPLYETQLYIIQDPITTLEKAILNENWFTGVILSATYLEIYGKKKIKQFFEEHGIKLSHKEKDITEDLNLFRTIKFLYNFGIIDKKMYEKMEEIRRERNKLVHEEGKIHRQDICKARKLIEDSIDIIIKLGAEK